MIRAWFVEYRMVRVLAIGQTEQEAIRDARTVFKEAGHDLSLLGVPVVQRAVEVELIVQELVREALEKAAHDSRAGR